VAQIEAFGITTRGEQVQKITLHTPSLTVSILTFGAVLQSVRLAGVPYDLTLGSQSLCDYEGDLRYNGSIIGPVVNRLTHAKATIAGKIHSFDVNFNGRHTLHSGSAGTQTKVWQLVRATDTQAILAIDLPDGEGGFPGQRRIEAQFTLETPTPDAPSVLRLTIASTTDAATIMNVTNHSYWNLDGAADFTGHQLRIAADHYLPTNDDFVPTGEIRAVQGKMDFRAFCPIAPQDPSLDTCYCTAQTQVALRPVLWLLGQSGLMMTVSSTEPGVQVYDCRHAGFHGLAVEAQGWPDAPNKPEFPQSDLGAGQKLVQVTQWAFDRP
jgi:aldose 1-epimerase